MNIDIEIVKRMLDLGDRLADTQDRYDPSRVWSPADDWDHDTRKVRAAAGVPERKPR